MEFAVNYSPQAAALLQQGAIRIDRFKCPDWPDLISVAQAHAPVYVHFSLNAGSSSPQAPAFDVMEQMLQQTHTPYVNLHLISRQADFPDWPADSTGERFMDAVAQRMLAHVQAVAQHFGSQRVIAESIPYPGRAREYVRPVAEPVLIRRVVQESACGFLLDLSHARLAARALGIDECQYIDSLPVEHLCELHITGLGLVDGVWWDHMPLRDEDWLMAQWALDRIHRGDWPAPWVVSLEYGGVGPAFAARSDLAVIAEQVPRLYDLVQV